MTRIQKWERTKLGSVATFTNGGAWNASEYVESGLTVIRVTDCKNGTIDISACKHLPKESYEKYRKHQLIEGDLVVATVGSHPTQPESVVGRPIIVPKEAAGALLNQNAVCIRPIQSSIINKHYLSHFAKNPFFSAYIISCARGTANQVRMSIGLLKEMPMELPPLMTQQKIAFLLSAYDDLIENNTRRIKILEEIAQTIYNEWFMKFRFPGHENVKMVESELGMIPEGWKVTTLSEVTSYINRGIAPKYDDESSILVINQRCIRENKINIDTARRHNGKVPSDKYVRFGDVLINSTGVGTLGRVAQLCEKIDNCTVDTHVSIVRPSDEVELYYFGIALQQLESYFESQGEGATGQTELRRDRIGQTLLLMPPINLQKLFSTFVSPKRQIINILLQKNRVLCFTRDLLLPRLISGEIDVSELDIDVGGITA